MIKALQHFKRTSCSCDPCTSFCKGGNPGCLAPGDIDHIFDHMGVDESEQSSFLTLAFKACTDGPTAPSDTHPSGRTPAIRPKSREDGSCVFFNRRKGLCNIHKVAPFGCRSVDQCTHPPSGAGALRALGIAITKSADYVMMWTGLWNRQEKMSD